MAALILPLISNKNGAVYDSTVGVISRLLQSDVAKAGDPQRASEILVRVVKREHLPRVHRITRVRGIWVLGSNLDLSTSPREVPS